MRVADENSAVMTIHLSDLNAPFVCIHPVETVTHPIKSKSFN